MVCDEAWRRLLLAGHDGGVLWGRRRRAAAGQAGAVSLAARARGASSRCSSGAFGSRPGSSTHWGFVDTSAWHVRHVETERGTVRFSRRRIH